MERIGVEGLASGTSIALEQKAIEKKFLKKNGKPNVSAYIRHLIERATGVKQEQQ